MTVREKTAELEAAEGWSPRFISMGLVSSPVDSAVAFE